MPFYEYRCTACSHQDSFLESINAPQQKTCPQCGKRRAFQRLISAAGFQLKGEGWYVTDFKNKDKPKAKSEGRGEEKSGEKDGKKEDKGDKKSDSKSDSKGDGKGDSKSSGGAKESAKDSAK